MLNVKSFYAYQWQSENILKSCLFRGSHRTIKKKKKLTIPQKVNAVINQTFVIHILPSHECTKVCSSMAYCYSEI